MAKEVPNQLKHGISPCNVEIDFRLLMIKPLHAKICTFICRVVHSYAELYIHMQKDQEKSLMVSNLQGYQKLCKMLEWS